MGDRRGSRQVLTLLVTLLLVALSAGLAAAACGGSTSGAAADAPSPTPKQGGTYNYPLSADPSAFDPFSAAVDGQAMAVLHELYEGLVRYEEQPDGTLKTVPSLAVSWSANADATVWTFKLRQGVMFQAPVSREVTAADVVADLRYLADRADQFEIAFMLDCIKGMDLSGHANASRLAVEALDRYTLRFSLKYPFSEFPDTLGNPAFCVWPVDYAQKVGLNAYEQHPVGTGPYQFLRRVPGTSVDLVRNPQWWDTSGGPYIDTIHYEVYGSVPSMLLAFQKGLVDWTFVPQGQAAASRSLPQVENGQWKAETFPLLGMRWMFVNMKDPVLGGAQGLPLRQALSYGYDQQATIAAVNDGAEVPSAGLVPPGVAGADRAHQPYPYDLAKAKELMKGIGPVTLELVYPYEQQRTGTAESIKAAYARIGITIKLRGMDWSKVFGVVYGKRAPPLFFGGWYADYPSMYNFLQLFIGGENGYPMSYSNPEADALLAKARATLGEEARLQLYAEAEQKMMADAPAVPVYAFADFKLLNNRVAGVHFKPMYGADLWRAWVK
jgi:peptide/nickel transport system substrate-binding protein